MAAPVPSHPSHPAAFTAPMRRVSDRGTRKPIQEALDSAAFQLVRRPKTHDRGYPSVPSNSCALSANSSN